MQKWSIKKMANFDKFEVMCPKRVLYGLSLRKGVIPEGVLIGLCKNIWDHAHKDFYTIKATRAQEPYNLSEG